MQEKNQEIQDILERLSIQKLNEMQLSCSKNWNKYKDLLLLSPTGSGKTLAFLLPILAQLKPDEKRVQTLILTPARNFHCKLKVFLKQWEQILRLTVAMAVIP